MFAEFIEHLPAAIEFGVISFDAPATSKTYFGVQFLLEDELGQTVDLVTEKALRPELKLFIEQEAINV